LSLWVFVGGFTLILLYDAFLRINDWRKRKKPEHKKPECEAGRDPL
jgi:hypothetical protein